MAGEKILIVDDEAVVQEILKRHLIKEGFQVIITGNGFDTLELLRTQNPDLVLLDILLPGLDGLEVCQELRKNADIPVIFITSKDSPFDLALGLGVGGDDYIKKPFEPIEVVARVKAQLRRYRQQQMMKGKTGGKQVLEFSGFRISLSSCTVEVNGSPVSLTTKEFDLLMFFVENPDRFFSTGQIIETLWKYPKSIDQRAFMVHISNLRKKIEEDPSNPKYITTLKGKGYKFNII